MEEEDHIIVYAEKSPAVRKIYFKSDFCKGDLVVNITHEKIVFKKPDIDYTGKISKVSYVKNTGRYSMSYMCDIPLGKYYFDKDESNEDQQVVYFKQ